MYIMQVHTTDATAESNTNVRNGSKSLQMVSSCFQLDVNLTLSFFYYLRRFSMQQCQKLPGGWDFAKKTYSVM